MSRSPRLVLAGLLLAPLPACLVPGPRVPFDTGRGWMLLASGSERGTDDRYIHSYVPLGLELYTLTPGTGGWGWEISGRFGQDTGHDKETKRVMGTFDQQPVNYTADVPVTTERESKIYELNVGVRQIYRPDSELQPFLGVGLTGMYFHNSDDLTGEYLIVSPTDPNLTDVFVPVDQSSRDWNLGLYTRAGLAWRVFGDVDGKRLSTFLTTDVRGFVGTEWNYVELNIGLGIGR